MILVDTSVWIHHFRQGDEKLRVLLEDGEVLMHEAVVGELACGTLHDRSHVLKYLKSLPSVSRTDFDETLFVIESRRLWGKGIGWLDAQLLASALLGGCKLLTYDKRLHEVSAGLHLAA